MEVMPPMQPVDLGSDSLDLRFGGMPVATSSSYKAISKSWSFSGTTDHSRSRSRPHPSTLQRHHTMSAVRSFGFLNEGVEVALHTKVPGTLYVSYPQVGGTALSANSSQPTIDTPTTSEYAVDFDFGPESQSLLHEDIYMRDSTPTSEELTSSHLASTTDTTSPTSPCPVSPAATEIAEFIPENQDTILESLGVKVRDFAYATSSPTSCPTPAAEIFDARKGIAEYEYRLSQSPRTLSIPGKITRRLLDMGWITEQEGMIRWQQMDWDALDEYDAQPMYPWRPQKWDNVILPELGIPSMEARIAILQVYRGLLMAEDRVKRSYLRRQAVEAVYTIDEERWNARMRMTMEDDVVEDSEEEEDLMTSNSHNDNIVPASPSTLGKRRSLYESYPGTSVGGSTSSLSGSPSKKRRFNPLGLQLPKQFPAQPELNRPYELAIANNRRSFSQPTPPNASTPQPSNPPSEATPIVSHRTSPSRSITRTKTLTSL